MFAIKWLAATIAVVGLTAAFAQPPPPADAPKPPAGGLDEVLAKALANSPDIQVAEAKVREAEAELRRARLNLMQKVIEAQATIETQKRQVVAVEAELARVAKMAKTGVISQEDVHARERTLTDAKAAVARSEVTLNALIGTMPDRWRGMIGDGGARIAIGEGARIRMVEGEANDQPTGLAPHPAMADKIRAALDARVKGADFQESALSDAIETIGKASGKVPFVQALGDKRNEQIKLSLPGEVPLGAQLQAIQDLAPGLTICVRDYGLLFTFDTPPVDGVTLAEFWHGKKRPPIGQ